MKLHHEVRPLRNPDPLLAANIYCSGRLDDLFGRVLIPFRRTLRQSSLAAGVGLWTIRYSRRGEHLKVRLHGDVRDREALARLLAECAKSYFESLSGVAAASPRVSRGDVPPIDAEDEIAGEAPDRSLLWTSYRRRPVSLGGSPWIEDDGFVAHATQCLACGCELLMAAVEGGTELTRAARQKLLLKALISGLGALGLGERKAGAEYLRYHRDWLLRFFSDTVESERATREQFGAQVLRQAAVVDRLRGIAAEEWARGRESAEVDREPWHSALHGLASHIDSFRGRDEYRVDPFAAEITFPPIFKVLHGVANQIGLHPLEEAYVHHLVLASVEPLSVESTGEIREMAVR